MRRFLAILHARNMEFIERPQKGRYRQFHQIGCEAFGYEGPDIDAEMILLSARLFHGSNLLAPVQAGDRERLKPIEDRLHELGVKPRSW